MHYQRCCKYIHNLSVSVSTIALQLCLNSFRHVLPTFTHRSFGYIAFSEFHHHELPNKITERQQNGNRKAITFPLFYTAHGSKKYPRYSQQNPPNNPSGTPDGNQSQPGSACSARRSEFPQQQRGAYPIGAANTAVPTLARGEHDLAQAPESVLILDDGNSHARNGIDQNPNKYSNSGKIVPVHSYLSKTKKYPCDYFQILCISQSAFIKLL